jgi:hypothetical protein
MNVMEERVCLSIQLLLLACMVSMLVLMSVLAVLGREALVQLYVVGGNSLICMLLVLLLLLRRM